MGIKELGDAVRAFYSSRDGGVTRPAEPLAGEDLLFSEEPLGQSGPVVDDNFITQVFEWVSRSPEVSIREAEETGARSALSRSGQSKPIAAEDAEIASAEETVPAYTGKRLCTGEERVWYAITGHGVDYKRIPPLEFQALSVIAAHGSKGVLQPDVTTQTGQDKRSLPKRTDNLAKNGYIVKINVVARSTKTSLLKLKKFAGEPEKLVDDQALPGTSIIEYNVWYDKAMELLKQNDNIIAFQDMRVGLGIQDKRHETRALHRCIRRLANAGCLRKVAARVALPDGDLDHRAKKAVRSLQLLREPTEFDRIAFMKSDWKSVGHMTKMQAMGVVGRQPSDDKILAEDLDADGDGDEDDDYVDIETLAKPRFAPIWTADLPFANFLRDRIEKAGAQGICSSDLYNTAVGHFWKRSTDEMLVRLTDLWQHSQPPHLRHLSIIRDTSQKGKQPVFQYRTCANFHEAVKRGDAYWEGIACSDLAVKNRVGKKKLDAPAATQPVLDDWGFPRLELKLFAGTSGAATLEECRRAAPANVGAKSGFALFAEPRQGLHNKAASGTKAGTDLARQYQADYRHRRQLEKENEEWAKSARTIAQRRAYVEFGVARPKGKTCETGQTALPASGVGLDRTTQGEPGFTGLATSSRGARDTLDASLAAVTPTPDHLSLIHI